MPRNDYLNIYKQRLKEEEQNAKAEAARALAENANYASAEALKEAAANKRMLKLKAYPAFKESVQNRFVGGFLWALYEQVLDKNMASDFAKSIGRGAVESYVKENGAMNIVRNMNGKSLYLTEAAQLIDSTIESVLEDVDPGNEDTYAINPEKEMEFYDDLSNSETDDITNTIRMRVVDAEEKMATDNIKDKLDMDEIMRTAADRINAVKTSNYEGNLSDDSAEQQQQEAVMMSKYRMNKVANDRPRSVLEQMVRTNSKKVLMDDNLRKVYSENGQINFDKLIEATTAVYGFMETLNTLKIEEFDRESLKKMIS